MSCHPSHETRVSMDASTWDEICIHCGHTDIAAGGWGKLAEPCPETNRELKRWGDRRNVNTIAKETQE